ncbi:MAG: helix-turn-helix transcriptional regulator [Bacteroidales bacterium]|nr:helix-turn-helix transcriptional regulator [Bacteroidales bacterium]
MKEQILKLLSFLNISATQFAEEIGVQRSSISHILSERNKPSYDFIIKILDKYPEINPAWLLTGNGEMLIDKNEPSDTVEPEYKKSTDLFENIGNKTKNENYNAQHIENAVINKSKQQEMITDVNDIESVIILYTNGTFCYFKKK